LCSALAVIIANNGATETFVYASDYLDFDTLKACSMLLVFQTRPIKDEREPNLLIDRTKRLLQLGSEVELQVREMGSELNT
jgi:hypothetical protein